ncbi:cytochrome P450 [Mycobacterium sp. shizuoka-1]|uniref:cytochrome P450 n=1 Tax=Mycobacterium sp. shizuoka-1 TaxID=2039281 RepID=UPI00267F0971
MPSTEDATTGDQASVGRRAAVHRAAVPSYRANIYSTEAILDPHPHYRRLRDLGPVVWLPRHKVYALPRYAECKAALLDDETFRSTAGVALNALSNRLSRGTTLGSDGAEHDRSRKLVAHRMFPRALNAISESVQAMADEVVDAAVCRGEVDGVQLATALPLAVMPDMVGWPVDQRAYLLDWAAATFDILGPANSRFVRGIPRSVQMLRFARRMVRDRSVLPGSMADELLTAVDAGVLKAADCPALLIDYLGPALDTTIGAISTALAMFAAHPQQWDLLKSEPDRIPNAINEIVRYESAVRAFGRRVNADTEIGGVALPAGSHVLVMYASANRDEREWERPDAFDITRDAGRHLGFGKGAHACAGQAVARMETGAVLTALLHRVDRLELIGPPQWVRNNIIRRYARMPLRLVGAR